MFPMIVTPSNKILLVFDSARSHISKEIKAFMRDRKILFCVIPGGLTGFLQPADAFWFKPMKSKLRTLANQWLESENVERTRSGKIMLPSNHVVARWLLDSWNVLDAELIRKSFRECFLGSTDELLIANDPMYGERFVREAEKGQNNGDTENDFPESGLSEIDE